MRACRICNAEITASSGKCHYCRDEKVLRIVTSGYRVISKMHAFATRIDKKDWIDYLARKMYICESLGTSKGRIINDKASYADFYRRLHSKDGITLTEYELTKVPMSCESKYVGYREKFL